MRGFIRVSPYLVRNLKPIELTLYYAIEHFNITNAYCFAAASTLMKLSGIRDPRTYRQTIKALLDRGLIVHHGRKRGRGGVTYQSLFHSANDGLPVLKSFLFNSAISPTNRAIAIARQAYPKATSADLAELLKVSASTIKHSPKVSPAILRPTFEQKPRVQEMHMVGCKKCTISNNPEQTNHVTTQEYVNLLGEQTNAPQDTNPVVILNLQLEEEQKRTEYQAKETQTATDEVSLNILDEYPEYKLLIEDLKRLYPKLHDDILLQTAFETVKKSKQIKSTRLSYAMGIIKQHVAGFPDRASIQTILPANKIIDKLSTQAEAKKAQAARAKNEQREAQDAAQLEKANRAFYDCLTHEEREGLTPTIEALGNPAGVGFITPAIALLGALGSPEFVTQCREVITAFRPSAALGVVASHDHNPPSFANATQGDAHCSGWPVLRTGLPSH